MATLTAEDKDTSWIDQWHDHPPAPTPNLAPGRPDPTGADIEIPQADFSPRPSKTIELDPSDVEVQPEKPVELSADDVEVQGGLGGNNGAQPQNPANSDDSGRKDFAQPAQPTEDMTVGPPSWAQKPGTIPQPQAGMQESALGKVAGAFSGVDMSPEEKAKAQGALTNELRDTPAARAGRPLVAGPVTLGRGLRDVYQGLNSGDPYAEKPTKEEAQQLLHGTAETVAGAVQTYTLGKAGELVELGPMVSAGSREAQVALLKFIGSIEVGAGASQGMDMLAKKLGFSQGAREVSDTIAQFLPQLIGIASSTKSFASENAPVPGAPEGTTAYGVQTGGNRAGAVVTEAPTGERTLHVKLGNATKNIKLPPNEVTARRGPFEETQPGAGPAGPANPQQGQPGAPPLLEASQPWKGPQGRPVAPEPPPPPDPAAVTEAQNQQAGVAALQQRDALRQAAENVQNGKPPVPPPRQAPGMAEGVIKPEVVADLGRIAEIVGPEHQADIVQEFHQTLTEALEKQPTVVLPNGKIEIVDSPKKAATVAAGVINDEIERQGKARLEQSKTQNEQQAQQNEQLQKGQETLEQRAKTILAANPDHPNPVGLLQRNLGVDQPTAQALHQGVQSPAEAQTGALVGSDTHTVTEEPPAQVDAQLKALQAGTIPVVMLPEGSQYEPELPKGMKKLTVSGDAPGAGTYIYDPRKIRPATIKEAAKAGTHGDLLGHVQTKEEIPAMKEPVVLQAHQNGQPIQETVVDGADHGKLMAAHDQLAERHPGAEIVAKTPEQVQAERSRTIENDRDQKQKPQGPYHLEPAKPEDMAPGASHEGVSIIKDANGIGWAIGDTDRMQQKADQYNAEEGHPVAPKEAGAAQAELTGGEKKGLRNALANSTKLRAEDAAAVNMFLAQEYGKPGTYKAGDALKNEHVKDLLGSDLGPAEEPEQVVGPAGGPATEAEKQSWREALANWKKLRAQDAAAVNKLLGEIEGEPGEYKAGDTLSTQDRADIQGNLEDAEHVPETEVAPRTGDVFDQAERQQAEDDFPFPRLTGDKLFPAPKEQFYADKVGGTKGGKDLPEIPQEEATKLVESWKAEAARIGREEDHSNDVIFSLFDRTGAWSKPWRDAGYDVRQYDIDNGDDLMRFFPIGDIMEARKQGKNIAGVLAAPPCTSFAVSGARWWKPEHDVEDEGMVAKKYGLWATTYFDTPLEYAKTLVHTTELFVELAAPQFHVMENPIGRIQSVADIPKPLLTFDPANYGDPYTKRTQLWGSFNPNLPTANVEPTEGSMIHKLRGDVEEDKARRSQTPEGFAYAFFMANHGQAAAAEAPAQGDVFDQVEKQVGDRRNAARESSVDRRQNPEQRARVAEMSPAQLRQELLTSHTVGLPNRRAFDEAQEENPTPFVGMSDVDGLKAFNDKFGYEAGNALLKAKADALKAATVAAYHDKGDEFLYRSADLERLRTKLEHAREIFRTTPITVTMTDGTTKQFTGADFSYGTGNDLEAAESGLKQHKSEREARGERARGELRGIAEAGPEKGSEGGSGEERKYEYGSTQHTLEPTSRAAVAVDYFRDSIPDNELAGKGKDIDGNHVTLRYGIQGNDLEGIRNFLAQQRPFLAKLGDLEVFPPSKHSDGAAVVVAKVESPQLHTLNDAIQKHGDFAPSNFPDYQPHVTIAYIKPEFADKYKGVQMRKDATFRVGSIDITDRAGNKETVQLGKPAAAPAKHAPKRSLVLPAGTNAKLGPEKTITVSTGKAQEDVTGPTVRFPGIRNEFVVHPAAFGSYEGEAWTVTEASSGLAVTTQTTRDIAIRSAEATLNHVGQQGLDAAMAKSGISVVPSSTAKETAAGEPATPAKTYEAEVQRFAGDPERHMERVEAENRRHAEQLLAEKFPGHVIGSAGRVETPATKETSTDVGESPTIQTLADFKRAASLPNAALERLAENGYSHAEPRRIAKVNTVGIVLEDGSHLDYPPASEFSVTGDVIAIGRLRYKFHILTGQAAPAEPKKLAGGDLVTFKDAKGKQREGTLVGTYGMVARIDGEKDGKPWEYTVATSKVKASGDRAGAPASLDSAGAGRAPGSAGGGNRKPMGGVPPALLPGTEGGGELGDGGAPDGLDVHQRPEPVPEQGTGSGHGEGSDTAAHLASSGEVDPGKALAGSPAEKPAAEAEAQRKAPAPARNKDWFTHGADWHPPTGEMTRLNANFAAIKLLREIEKNPRKLTAEEKEALANYVGWGALSKAFDPYTAPHDEFARWQAANKQLHELLNDEEFQAARRSVTNAHYTSPEMVRFMWEVMKRFGFQGGNMLEPSMGSGNFLGMMPKAMRSTVHAIVNELDPTTFKIAQQLYPSATLMNKDFKDVVLPDNDIDLAISNVPFGDWSIFDPKYPKMRPLVHDYFFIKALDKVKPGGVVAFITSTGTMDKGSAIRQALASKADLLGAIRLPSTAFKKSSGTSVTTDLIFLRKRLPGEEPSAKLTGNKWMEVRPMELRDRAGQMQSVPVNEYFHDHPEMVLGIPESHSQYGPGVAYSLQPHPDVSIDTLLEGAMKKLPRGIMLPADPTGSKDADTAATFAPDTLPEKQFTTDEKGRILQRIDGKLVPAEAVAGKDGRPVPALVERAKALIDLRNEYNQHLSDMKTLPDDEAGNSTLAKQRDQLRKKYDKFVKKNGIIHSSQNRKVFEEDPHWPRLQSLEQHDTAKKTTTLADVFTKRTVYPAAVLKALSPNPQDALNQILAERGYPDMNLMALLRGSDVATVAAEFVKQGLIFRDPSTGDYQTREKYLSGYVRDKLADAKLAVEQGMTEYQPNVEALEKAQPKDIPIKEISVKLGATWVPLPALEDFILDTFKAEGRVRYAVGTWGVDKLRRTAEVSTTYGMRSYGADDLMEMALNQREPLIKVKDADGKEHTDAVGTAVARAQQNKIRQAFNDWAASSVKWADPLEKGYNYAYNNLVHIEYDGSHLTFPGMNPLIVLRPHQRSVIWRIIQEGRALIAHDVGSGKTWAICAAIMEERRMGSSRKAMVAVPKGIVRQWQNAFMQLYPGAKILVPTPRDFERKNRQRLMARIASGEYDAVILSHSQFNLMDISAPWQKRTLDAQMEELVQTIRALKAAKADKLTVKQMEKQREKLREKLDRLSNLRADNTINFDDLGVDRLYVDEAHKYKNLAFTTKMTRIGGLAQGNAKSALRLKMKCDFLQQTQKGKGVILATGTPVSNTMAEIVTMMKYVAPDVLEKAGIHYFDDWAANFGLVVTKPTLSIDGRSYKIRQKFAKFVNVPELMSMIRNFTDVKTARQLALPTPELETGKPIAHYVEATPMVEAFIQSLQQRAKAIKGKPVQGGDNMLAISTDGRKAAIDMRLIDPSFPDEPTSKINAAVKGMYDEWKAGDPGKLTQVAFLNLYQVTDKDTGAVLLDLYDDMMNKLAKMGVPREQMAKITQFKTDASRQEAFDKMNSGELRILFGSGEKMGAGVNAQELMIALNHLDNEWKPGDMHQRNGRILRQGNKNPVVKIVHWLTMRSFDTFQLQVLHQKANFIEQLWNGTYQGREMEDVSGDASLTYEEMMVATSGNPDVKLQFDLQAELNELENLKWGYESQRRDSLQQASGLRMYASSAAGWVSRAKKALERMAEVKGKDGEGYKVELDGKTYDSREALGEAIKDMEVLPVNFHMTMNGVGVYVIVKDDKGLPTHQYTFDFDNDRHNSPERTMDSFIRSMEGRLSHLPQNITTTETQIERDREKAAKLDEEAKKPFPKQAEMDETERQLAEVTKRLTPELQGGDKERETSDIADIDESPDEEDDEDSDDEEDDEDDEDRPRGGSTTMRASVFGLDYAAEFVGKQALAFWKSDVGPALTKAGTTAKAAGKYIAEIVYPRFNANEDMLDSIMAAKGEMEKSRFLLEHINGGMEKFFDKMTLDQHLAFIDRYKLGVGQPSPELQKAEDLIRAIDDLSLKEAQKYRPNLTAKENHFRVLWKVIPNSKTPGPQAAPGGKGGNPTNYRRPYEGDKGFMKRATLDTISEGINYGGEPYSTNPWKLFTMAQASIKKYIAAQEHWKNLKGLGLRKFVALGDAPPPDWAKVDDRIGDVYFRADSGEGSIHSGRWYLEPSSARILNNFLSRDLIRENPVGNALLLAKNLTTALSLSLSPFHFLFETLEAMGSQFGVGVSRFTNVAARKGDYGQGLLALREMGSFMSAPVLYARAGGSLIRATADFHSFAQTKRGQAFLTQYPDAIHHLDLYFKGGGQFNMNPDYRVDLTKSLRQAMQENNYVGAALRIVPALGQALMHPLFQVYIPRLKMGFFLAQNAMKQLDMDKELANGDTTELEIARQVVDATENRFGELNFSNLFWNNTFKSVMQFAFRSVTWKLGNWRGAGVAGAEAAQGFADPLRAMWEDAKAGKARPGAREDYIPRIGVNLAWLIGMGTVATVIGTILSKALSGKFPWEWAGEDKKNDHSLPGAVLLEMMHPRTGRRDPRSGLPERVTLPIGLKDFEHAIRDPKGYLRSSESDLLSRTTDLLYNRDFFGNYVYDPNAPLYQQAADSIYYLIPQPIAYQGFTQKYGAQDVTSKLMRAAGVGNTSKTLDQSKLERELQQKKWDEHKPMTPEQVRRMDNGEHVARHVSAGELRRHIREGRMTHLEKLVEGMTYSDIKRIFDRDATPSEKRLLGPMLQKKRQSLLRRKGYAAVEAAQ